MKKIYRVWDKRSKCFVEDKVTLTPDGKLLYYYCLSMTDDPYWGDYYGEPVIQYSTGLKDKHNKTIFDGDIVKVIDRNPKIDSLYSQGYYRMLDGSDPFETTIRHFIVYWDGQGMWATEYIDWFKTYSGDEDGQPIKGGFIPEKESIEIIGNIFQNTQLLNIQK